MMQYFIIMICLIDNAFNLFVVRYNLSIKVDIYLKTKYNKYELNIIYIYLIQKTYTYISRGQS